MSELAIHSMATAAADKALRLHSICDLGNKFSCNFMVVVKKFMQRAAGMQRSQGGRQQKMQPTGVAKFLSRVQLVAATTSYRGCVL